MRKVVFAMVLGAVVTGTGHKSSAEIVTDGSMGVAGALAGPDYSIPSTLGTQVGTNLFHSFSAFNIASGESATLSGPGEIGNVIARVTGGSTSSLNGPLRCDIQGANLFFLNPAGILFGPEASLDLSGSFYAGTATSLALGTTGTFDVSNPANDLLTTAPPQAFGFVGAKRGAMTMDSSALAVGEGESISLVAGRLSLVNNGEQTMLEAPGGTVNLVAVAAPGQVGLVDSTVSTDQVASLGTLTITKTGGQGSQADIDVSSNLNGGGAISIHSGRFVLNGAALTSDTEGQGDGGDITIEARKSALLKNEASISTRTYSEGDGGAILVATPELTIAGGSMLLSSTHSDSASGGGGEMRIDAESLTVRGSAGKGDDLYHSAIYSSSHGPGAAGDIVINGKTVAVEDEGWISSDTHGSGPGGHLRIRSEDFWVAEHGWVSTDTFDSGRAGGIDLKAGFVGVDTGGKITTDSYGSGDAGTLAIQVDDLGVYVGGYMEQDGEIFFSAIRSQTFGSGSGGEITISAPTILVEEGGGIASSSNDEATGNGGSISITTDGLRVHGSAVIDDTTYRSDINASSYGSGEAGDITIAAWSLAVEDEGAIYSDANGEGAGGHIRINSQRLEVSDHGWLSTDTYGSGDAGSLVVEAGEVAMTSGGQITSDSYDSGQAGDLTVKADEILVSGYLEIDGETYSSKISSDAMGSGRGGAITVEAPRILLENSGGIESRSRYEESGDGGNISIAAEELTVRGVAEVNASSFGSGSAGDIHIHAGSVALEEVGTIASFANAQGDGGNISLFADDLSVKGVAEYNGKLYRSLINASSYGAGRAGGIDIQAGAVTISDGGGLISLATATGDGGTISLAADDLTVTGYGTDGGLISKSIIDASSEWSGEAGDIVIDAAAVTLSGAGTIASNAFSSGDGGDIAITAGTLQVEGWTTMGDRTFLSSIDASSSGAGKAGDITIDAGTMALRDAGSVNSLAEASGKGGNISIRADEMAVEGYALVNNMSFRSSIDASSLGEGEAGGITIDAGKVRVTDAGAIATLARDGGRGGDLVIRADELLVAGYTGLAGTFLRSAIDSSSYGAGAAGDITIEATTMTIEDQARVVSLSLDAGNGGDIAIRTDALRMKGAATVDGVTYASSINASSHGTGAAGDIAITAGTVTLEDAAAIETYAKSTGNGGDITITTDRLGVRGYALGAEIYQSLINASSYGAGTAGDIIIDAREVSLADGGSIASVAMSAGNGGDIALATETLEVKGYGRSDLQFAQSSINASSLAEGDAGDITINAGAMTLSNAGAIASLTASAGAGGTIAIATGDLTVRGKVVDQEEQFHSIINASSYGSGAAGNIVANAATVRLEDGGTILSMASATGNGGTIAINAEGSLLLTDAGLTSASTSTEPGAGRAGNIAIKAGDLLRMNESVVATSSVNADGGDITIDPTLIDLIASEITTSVQGGSGNGGNIAMDGQAVVLDHSTVSANAYGGNGGNISLTADLLLKDPQSLLSASSALGLQGVIALNVPQVDIGAEIVNLPETFFDDQALFPKSCVEREEDLSSFVVRGRDGLPPSPASLLPGL